MSRGPAAPGAKLKARQAAARRRAGSLPPAMTRAEPAAPRPAPAERRRGARCRRGAARRELGAAAGRSARGRRCAGFAGSNYPPQRRHYPASADVTAERAPRQPMASPVALIMQIHGGGAGGAFIEGKNGPAAAGVGRGCEVPRDGAGTRAGPGNGGRERPLAARRGRPGAPARARLEPHLHMARRGWGRAPVPSPAATPVCCGAPWSRSPPLCAGNDGLTYPLFFLSCLFFPSFSSLPSLPFLPYRLQC